MPTKPTYVDELPVTKVLANTLTKTTDATLADLTGLVFNIGDSKTSGRGDLALNATYRIVGNLLVDGGSSGNLKTQVVLTSGTGTTIKGFVGGVYTTGASATAFSTTGSGTTQQVAVDLVVKTGSTAGTIKLQAAQNASNATATNVFADSWVQANRRLN